MIEGEIARAYHQAMEQGGHPAILPVRVAYQEPFRYPLSAYLDALNWAAWTGPEDTPRLVDDLLRAVADGEALQRHGQSLAPIPRVAGSPFPQPVPAAQPARLALEEATMDPESAFYVVRPADAVALDAIQREGVTITIKGPRQMGKSSLLLRTNAAASAAGKRVVFVDF